MSLNYLEISTPRPFTATPATFSFMSLHYLTLILLHVFTLPGSLHRHPRHVSPPPSLTLPPAPHQETFTLQQKRRNGSGLDRTNCGPGICGVWRGVRYMWMTTVWFGFGFVQAQNGKTVFAFVQWSVFPEETFRCLCPKGSKANRRTRKTGQNVNWIKSEALQRFHKNGEVKTKYPRKYPAILTLWCSGEFSQSKKNEQKQNANHHTSRCLSALCATRGVGRRSGSPPLYCKLSDENTRL